MTVSGGLAILAERPRRRAMPAPPLKQTVVNIRVPNQPVLIRGRRHRDLSVSNFTLDGQDKKALAQQQSFTFAVGAQITVPAGTVDGIYAGISTSPSNIPDKQGKFPAPWSLKGLLRRMPA
jgi:hypothetical protein